MRAFLRRHVREYRLAALFDARGLEEPIRRAFVFVPTVAAPLGALVAAVLWVLEPRTTLLPIMAVGVLFGLLGFRQLRKGDPDPTGLYAQGAAVLALAAVFGGGEPIGGIVAGAAVAATGSFSLIRGRSGSLSPLLRTIGFLSVALYASEPASGTLIGIGVLGVSTLTVWWFMGTLSDEVRLLNARFRALIDDSSSGIVIVGDSGVIDFLNDAARGLVGDLVGKPASGVVDLSTLGETTSASFVTGEDGTLIPVSARCSRFSVRSSGFDLVVFEDQRPRIEERSRLAASEAEYRDLFERVPVGLYTSTVEGAIVHANAFLVAMLGYDSVEQVLGVPASELYVVPEEREALSARLAGEGSLSAEYEVRRRDGSAIWVRDHSSVQLGPDGEPSHYHGELTDITVERWANEELRRTLVQREQLVAAVSHELRTPLTSVLGLAQVLVDGTLPDEEVKEIQGLIFSQSQELAFIVEDLLAASQLTHGGLRVTPRSVDLSAAVREALDMVGLGGRALEVSVPDGMWASGDPTRVRQVVRNLLTNVAKYGGRRVLVTGDVVEEGMAITVADDGAGLEEQTEEAFEAFRRLQPTRTDHGSLGLGLTLSRGLAQAMGGSLGYTHADGWARFTLLLPAVVRGRQPVAAGDHPRR